MACFQSVGKRVELNKTEVPPVKKNGIMRDTRKEKSIASMDTK